MIYVQVGDRLSSLVTGSPPIWITKRSGWLYFRSPIKCLMVFDIITNWCWSNFPNCSQARALERSIKLTSDSGEEQVTIVNIHLRHDNLRHCLHQMVFVIDSVLEPLLTNSIRNASFNQDITAGKLLARCVELAVIIRNFADVVTNNVEPNWFTNIFNKYMCNVTI